MLKIEIMTRAVADKIEALHAVLMEIRCSNGRSGQCTGLAAPLCRHWE